MNIQVEEISSLNGTLILPCFEGCEKPPSKSMNETGRLTRKLIKNILGSDDFSGKPKEIVNIFDGENKDVHIELVKKDKVN